MLRSIYFFVHDSIYSVEEWYTGIPMYVYAVALVYKSQDFISREPMHLLAYGIGYIPIRCVPYPEMLTKFLDRSSADVVVSV